MDIQIESVSFCYPSGVKALRDIDLRIRSGECVALIGENGAGKTTLAKHLNGLLRPTSGRVILGGKDTRGQTVAQLAHIVGYVFQNPDEQLFHRSVREEVAFGPKNMGKSGREIEGSVLEALSMVHLVGKADSHPYDLHPSERKLLGLACVLSMETAVLVLDEPTMGLDLQGVRLVAEIIEAYRQANRTVILISHDLDFCAEHVGRFVVMSNGRILEDGAPDEVLPNAEALREAGLEQPQFVRLAHALGLPDAPKDVDGFLVLLSRRHPGSPRP